jgi:hypothetical protein
MGVVKVPASQESNGGLIRESSKSTEQQDFATADNKNHGRGRDRVHSVLLASALHVDVDQEALASLPDRHQGGVKSGLG